MWSAIDVKHREWFEKAKEMAALVNVQPALPRTCGRQQHRDSHEADSPEEYFRRIVTIPMLDILLEQLQQRFGGLQQVAVKGHHLLPDVFLEDPLAARAAIHALANENVQFLPRARRGLDAELDMWEVHWRAHEDKPTTCQDLLETSSKHSWPDIYHLCQVMCTLPFTSCECERCASCLRRLKTYLRSTTGEERLTALALLDVHYGQI